MVSNRDKAKLLGLGLDNKDGELRATHGKNFLTAFQIQKPVRLSVAQQGPPDEQTGTRARQQPDRYDAVHSGSGQENRAPAARFRTVRDSQQRWQTAGLPDRQNTGNSRIKTIPPSGQPAFIGVSMSFSGYTAKCASENPLVFIFHTVLLFFSV